MSQKAAITPPGNNDFPAPLCYIVASPKTGKAYGQEDSLEKAVASAKKWAVSDSQGFGVKGLAVYSVHSHQWVWLPETEEQQ